MKSGNGLRDPELPTEARRAELRAELKTALSPWAGAIEEATRRNDTDLTARLAFSRADETSQEKFVVVPSTDPGDGETSFDIRYMQDGIPGLPLFVHGSLDASRSFDHRTLECNINAAQCAIGGIERGALLEGIEDKR